MKALDLYGNNLDDSVGLLVLKKTGGWTAPVFLFFNGSIGMQLKLSLFLKEDFLSCNLQLAAKPRRKSFLIGLTFHLN